MAQVDTVPILITPTRGIAIPEWASAGLTGR